IYHSHEEQQWIPLKNTRKTLEILIKNKNLKIAVLSNHPNHNSIENMLKKYKLLKYFDVIVTSAKFGKRKPDPKIFLYTIEKMGLTDPNSCFVVGDEYADIMGGHRAGLKPILFERKVKFPFEQEIKIKDYIKVKDITEILNYL
ncbi:MAG: HAD family hydrolase, partial [Candidatus Thorarchaeota archaeon]